MTTWSTVPPVSTSFSVKASASSSFSSAPVVSSTFLDFNDLGGYVEAGYVLADYVTGNIWTDIAGPSTTWVPA